MGQLYPCPVSSTEGVTIVAGQGLTGGGFVALGGTLTLAATGGSQSSRNVYGVVQSTNGATQIFTIANFPNSISSISYADVFLNGILQTLGTNYTLSGNIITFTSAPATGDVIEIVFSTPPGNRNQFQLTPSPNGSTTSFTFPSLTPATSYVDVFVNGILQTPGTDYNLNLTAGTWAVVFTTAPATGDILEAVFAPAEASTRNLYTTTPSPNGSHTTFTIVNGVPENQNLYIDVFLNGIYQTAGTDYNLNLVGGVWTIVYTTAPLTGDVLETVF